jgi:Predicted ATPase with chaperone activity
MVDNDVMTAKSISIVFMRCSTNRNDSLFDVIYVRRLSTKAYIRLFTMMRCCQVRFPPQMVDGLSVCGATSLSEVVQFLRGDKELTPVPTQPWSAYKVRAESDFPEAKGHELIRKSPSCIHTCLFL